MNKKELLNIIKTALMTLLYLVIICVAIVLVTKENAALNSQPNEIEQKLKEGKLADALAHYQTLAYEHPDDYTLNIKIGNIYEQLKEPKLAKIEYYKAIKKAPYGAYTPYFSLAEVYISQGDYRMAEEFISQIEDKPVKTLIKKKAAFYETLADQLVDDGEYTNAVLKYNQSHKYYLKFNNEKAVKVKEKTSETYIKIADNFMKSNDSEHAIQSLQNAVSTYPNPVAMYKLGLIYRSKGQPERASDFFKKAYDIKPSIINANIYYNLLMELSLKYANDGNGMRSKLYEFQAKKIQKLMPQDYDILLYVDSVEYNKNPKNKTIIPGINLRVRNLSSNTIEYLSIKIDFKENNHLISSIENPVIIKQNPLKQDQLTSSISIFSQTNLKEISKDKKYSMDIYISQNQPDEWTLYKTEVLENN